jgi:hypothetical protein
MKHRAGTYTLRYAIFRPLRCGVRTAAEFEREKILFSPAVCLASLLLYWMFQRAKLVELVLTSGRFDLQPTGDVNEVNTSVN